MCLKRARRCQGAGGQRISDALSDSSGIRIHGIPAPNALFEEGPYRLITLPSQAEYRLGRVRQPTVKHRLALDIFGRQW